ncbi:hypothetical protein QA597_05545 [Marinilabiliaceae bacterium ANBcel2]|nr:hypothetical protein [Marinilabiliaceae bacterium ANBcel2]
MIYYFRAISDESEDFIFEFCIDSKNYFIQLHNFLQEELNFDQTQMASFCTTDQEWQKEQEITLIDMEEEEGSALVMDCAKIEEIISDPKQRMLYIFDQFCERVLFIELFKTANGELKTAKSIKKRGTPPKGFDAETFDKNSDILSDELLENEDINNNEFPDDMIDPDSVV